MTTYASRQGSIAATNQFLQWHHNLTPAQKRDFANYVERMKNNQIQGNANKSGIRVGANTYS